jgi:hypothetical protein
MTADFEMLCTQTKNSAFILLEDWDAEFDPEIDVVDEVLNQALAATLPPIEDLDGEWIMQMMWQVPDLLVDTEYSEGMDVNKATWTAVYIRIGDTIRDDVRARAGELGLDPGSMRI